MVGAVAVGAMAIFMCIVATAENLAYCAALTSILQLVQSCLFTASSKQQQHDILSVVNRVWHTVLPYSFIVSVATNHNHHLILKYNHHSKQFHDCYTQFKLCDFNWYESCWLIPVINIKWWLWLVATETVNE